MMDKDCAKKKKTQPLPYEYKIIGKSGKMVITDFASNIKTESQCNNCKKIYLGTVEDKLCDTCRLKLYNETFPMQ